MGLTGGLGQALPRPDRKAACLVTSDATSRARWERARGGSRSGVRLGYRHAELSSQLHGARGARRDPPSAGTRRPRRGWLVAERPAASPASVGFSGRNNHVEELVAARSPHRIGTRSSERARTDRGERRRPRLRRARGGCAPGGLGGRVAPPAGHGGRVGGRALRRWCRARPRGRGAARKRGFPPAVAAMRSSPGLLERLPREGDEELLALLGRERAQRQRGCVSLASRPRRARIEELRPRQAEKADGASRIQLPRWLTRSTSAVWP